MKFLKTKDGSFSLYSDTYNDFYHSTKDGAILETLYKHIIPTFGLMQDLMNFSTNPINYAPNNPIKILDICFGLGYNALFSLAFAKKYNLNVAVYSMELHLLEHLRTFRYPKILQNYLPIHKILDALFLRGMWEFENLAIYLYKGDAKNYINNLANIKLQNNTFDIIYQDAFSPTKNVELWDESHFKNLYTLLKNNGVVSTYSSSKKVREICQNIGFQIYNMRCGNLKNGTILRKTCDLQQNFQTQKNPIVLQIDCIKLEKINFLQT